MDLRAGNASLAFVFFPSARPLKWRIVVVVESSVHAGVAL
jgi:hypothetical protein